MRRAVVTRLRITHSLRHTKDTTHSIRLESDFSGPRSIAVTPSNELLEGAVVDGDVSIAESSTECQSGAGRGSAPRAPGAEVDTDRAGEAPMPFWSETVRGLLSRVMRTERLRDFFDGRG